MPSYTKKSIMQVLNHFNADYEPRKQETDQQIATWVAESKTDGVVNISNLPLNETGAFILVYERVWVDQAAADAYYQFGIYLSEKYECPIESFEIVDNV